MKGKRAGTHKGERGKERSRGGGKKDGKSRGGERRERQGRAEEIREEKRTREQRREPCEQQAEAAVWAFAALNSLPV